MNFFFCTKTQPGRRNRSGKRPANVWHFIWQVIWSRLKKKLFLARIQTLRQNVCKKLRNTQKADYLTRTFGHGHQSIFN